MPKKTKDITQILSLSKINIALAAKEVKEGEVVAFGTETVYGLGANALDKKAVAKIFEVKGRPSDNPLIVHIHSLLQLKDLVVEIPDIAYTLAKKFMPGPLTIILKKSKNLPSEVTAGLDTVAIRMPAKKAALDFLYKCGTPLAAPSANISGFVSPTTANHVLADLNGKLKYILDTGECPVGLESTVIDLTVSPPTILRQGAISQSQIEVLIGSVAVSANSAKSDTPKAPGMKYRHYAPKASVIFSSFHNKMYEFISAAYDAELAKNNNPVILCLGQHVDKYGSRKMHIVGSSLKDYAKNLYSALRDCDTVGYKTIIAEGIPSKGIGAAIINRLMKASSNNII